ncbi:PBS lyase [Actinoplanes sp. N902-109]|uniref:PBS lyase n=1 Tax=Actinoplanes sp. (strain N902-109) TaxID=649831 RepID=UPI00032952F8|nr:PBS lyase [Actinoplanes sp. N902-109]AGL18126.1 PBS lyase HEAT domain-containing protein repeat-containing protein [Actinoplanes sp. N902-109]
MFDSLTCAYGPASEVPELLAGLRSADGVRRGFARSELEHMLAHEGTKYEASVAAVPFLIEIFTDPAGCGRVEAYELLTLISDNGELPRHRTRSGGPTLGELTRRRFEWRLSRRPADPAERYGWHQGELEPPMTEARAWTLRSYAAVGAGLPAYLPVVRDPDPRLRLAAAHLLAAHPAPAAVPVLTAQLRVESSPMVAASLCIAAGHCGEAGDVDLLRVLARWRESPHRLAHLSALMAIAQLTDAPDEPLLTELAACALEPEEWIEDWPFHGDPSCGACWALETLTPADNPGLARILLDKLRDHRAEAFYYPVVELLIGLLFGAAPLPDTARFADLTPAQQELVRLTIQHRLLVEAPMPSAFAGCNLPMEEVSLAVWAEL